MPLFRTNPTFPARNSCFWFWICCFSRLRRRGGSNLGVVARHTHVFQELGITRGQYTGLLPLLVRHGVASLFLMPEQDVATTTAADAGRDVAGVGEGEHETAPPRDGGWEEVGTVSYHVKQWHFRAFITESCIHIPSGSRCLCFALAFSY